MNECETCWFYDYDEEYDEYYCMQDLDEDEFYRIMTSQSQHCPSRNSMTSRLGRQTMSVPPSQKPRFMQ